MCQHTSSLLNSHNATMQRYINNAHQKGQLSSTLDVLQLRQLEPFLEQMVMASIQGMEKWEVYWTDCSFMPQHLVEIQVEQPQKDTQSLRLLMASGLMPTYVCLSWTFSVTQSKGNLGLATFYGNGFGTCDYNDKQWEIRRVMPFINLKKEKKSNVYNNFESQ